MYSRVKTIASIDVGRTYLAVSIWRKVSGDGVGHGILPVEEVGGEEEEEDFEYYHSAAGQRHVYPKDKFKLIYLNIDEFVEGSAPWQPVTLRHGSQKSNYHHKRKSTIRLPLNIRATCIYGLMRKHTSIYSPDLIFVEDQLNVANENKLVQCCIISSGNVRVISVPPMSKFDFKTTKMQAVSTTTTSKKNSGKDLKSIAMKCMKVLLESSPDDLEIEYDVRGVDMASVRQLYPLREREILGWYHKDLADCVLQGIQCISKMLSQSPYNPRPRAREEEEEEEKQTSSGSASLITDDDDDE